MTNDAPHSPAAPLIRPLQAGDRAAWEPLWRGYQVFYKVDIPSATTDATFSRLLDPTEPMFAALAWDGEAAVGLVHYLFHRSTWTTGDYCYLQDLFVSDSVRGRGVGRSLIAFVYARAAEAGASRVHWLTHETNLTAMKLYDQVADRPGFVQYRKLFG